MIAIKDTKIMEFQGEFENFDLFDGIFNPETLSLDFKNFSLQGRLIKKDFTLFESTTDEIKEIGKFSEVILFDKPPRFKIIK